MDSYKIHTAVNFSQGSKLCVLQMNRFLKVVLSLTLWKYCSTVLQSKPRSILSVTTCFYCLYIMFCDLAKKLLICFRCLLEAQVQ